MSKLIDTGMPTPTVVPSSGVKVPMKLLSGRDRGERGVLVGGEARGVLGGGRQLVGGGALELAAGLPALLVGGYLTGDGGAVGGGHLHLGERALGHGHGGGVVDGGVVGSVLGRDLDLRLGGLLRRRLVDLGL
ncbi:hypothetical protein RKD28_002755 [Streptomyces sp. SAI-229]